MRRQMLDILACPIDKNHPLEIFEIETKEDLIISGVLYCNNCSRYYPIIEEIPILFPDELRDRNSEIQFLNKHRNKLPEKIICTIKELNDQP